MNLRHLWQRTRRLIQHDIWHLPEQTPAGRRSFLLRLLRIVVLAARGFTANSLQLRASALVYYTLMSVVPTLALAFGIAKSFGLEAALEDTLRRQLAGQQEALDQVIRFSRALLDNTRGGLVAGVGVALLLWAAVRLLGTVEASFNAIWSVDRGRTVLRRITDYLAIAVLGPLLLLASSSFSVVVSGRVDAALAGLGVAEPVSGAVLAGLELVPFVLLWLLMTVVYLALPNTKVSWRAGLAAGVVAGTLIQVVQFGSIQLVVNVARYNAVYGSFAVLPLFLIWLYVSWLIVLVGAEVSFAVDNAGDYARERAAGGASHRQRRMLAVRLAAICAARFIAGRPPATAAALAEHIGVPSRLAHAVLHDLLAASVLVEVRGAPGQPPAYQPARDPEAVTTVEVVQAIDALAGATEDRTAPGVEPPDPVPESALGEVARRWIALDKVLAAADDNWTLAQLARAEDDAGGGR
ncbi:MAG: YihY family inner membrane protein [Krumholzibacteria bacterium]|nr:YihY family inner membrane protein [Candidatus Krumholzibacteria bacterium]